MPDQIPTRRLGKTDVQVSIVGVGGSHIGKPELTDGEAIDIIRTAIDNGITFMDNNWGYFDGVAELRMGEALKDGYRDRVFLMTKTDARDKAEALKQLDESLTRLRTTHIDLWQIHEVIYYNDPALIERDGILEALDEARRSGKVRFVGFTGHKDPALHLKTLDLYDFDTCQLPLNVMDYHFKSFEREVLPELLNRDIGVIGMKSYGDPHVLKSGLVTPREALSYALSLPVSTVVKGFQQMSDLESALEIARDFVPLSDREMNELRQRTSPLEVSGDGRYELYKTSMQYDAEPGRKRHGFPGFSELEA